MTRRVFHPATTRRLMAAQLAALVLAAASCSDVHDARPAAPASVEPKPEPEWVRVGLWVYAERVKLGGCWYVVAHGGADCGVGIVHAADCDNPMHAEQSGIGQAPASDSRDSRRSNRRTNGGRAEADRVGPLPAGGAGL